jgi:hypothetical protein
MKGTSSVLSIVHYKMLYQLKLFDEGVLLCLCRFSHLLCVFCDILFNARGPVALMMSVCCLSAHLLA